MSRRRELKRNDEKEAAPIPRGYWSGKGALCQSDTESSVKVSWAGAGAGPGLGQSCAFEAGPAAKPARVPWYV